MRALAGGLLAVGLVVAPAAAAERSFRMGFTPFPWDATREAIDWTYERVARHGDLFAHHLDSGVPWPEALAGDPFPPRVEAQIDERVRKTPDSHAVYLALTPISTFRDGLASYWSNEGPVPPPGAWADRGFASPKVVRAYVDYCLRLIERLEPDYVAYAIEVDLLARNDPAAYRAFRKLARRVYRRLKARHPDLPVFFTFTLGQPGGWEAVRQSVEPLLPYTDLLAISTYPYLANGLGGNPHRIPSDWFTRIRELDPAKSIAVAETGFTAEEVVFETLGITIPGRKAWQKAYLKRLLREARDLDMAFVVWFTVVDYDRLWDLMEEAGVSELFKAWRDTGLYDEELRRRGALKTWNRWLRRRHQPAARKLSRRPPTPGFDRWHSTAGADAAT